EKAGVASPESSSAIAAHRVEGQIVLRPPEQAGLDVHPNVSAITDEIAADEQPIIDLHVRPHHGADIEMPPRLRDVPRRRQIRGCRLERVCPEQGAGRRYADYSGCAGR